MSSAVEIAEANAITSICAFALFTSDTFLDIYRSATNGIFAVLIGGRVVHLGDVLLDLVLLRVQVDRAHPGAQPARGDAALQSSAAACERSLSAGEERLSPIRNHGHRRRRLTRVGPPASASSEQGNPT